jgi:hypothetical protein
VTASRIDYASPGPLTRIEPAQLDLVADLPADLIGICEAVQNLVIDLNDAKAVGIAEHRYAERAIRSASRLLAVLRTLADRPLHLPRHAELRVVGTCRHYALLTCTFLRMLGIPARARCGFATYFIEGKGLDHWIVEYWLADQGRWVRVDTELVGSTNVVDQPADLAPSQFLTGGQAWLRYRAGELDPASYGVVGTEHSWGIAELRGNTIRDLAALQKLEMLPWDEWGRMTESHHGRTGTDYDELIDQVAAATAGPDPALLAATYASQDLAVPARMIG